MGWTVYYASNSPTDTEAERREIEKLFTFTNAETGTSMQALAASKVGSTWYVAARVTGRPDPGPYVPAPDGSYVIAGIVLTSRKQGEWGYKDMEECSGPNEAKAPRRILDLLSPLDPDHPRANYALDWRHRCAIKPIRPKPGQRVRLPRALTYGTVEVQEVTCTTYLRRGKARTCYHHPEVGLLRVRPDDLIGAQIIA